MNDFNGKGLFIWQNERVYIGEWKNNKIDGIGTYKWKDGRIHVG